MYIFFTHSLTHGCKWSPTFAIVNCAAVSLEIKASLLQITSLLQILGVSGPEGSY